MEILWRDNPAIDAASLAQLDALGATSVSAPFGDGEVLSAWHATLPPGRLVRCCTATVDDRLVAQLLVSAHVPPGTVAAPTRWQLWGETIDFGVVWAEPDRAHECWRVWIDGLREQGVDQLRLRNVRMSDPAIAALFANRAGLGVSTELLDRRLAPFVDLSQGFDEWLNGRSKSQRKQYRRAMRTFQTVPDLRVDFVRDQAAVADAMRHFFALHRARRDSLDKGSVYDNSQAEDFLQALVGPWAERGRLGVLVATSGTTPIGVELVVTTDRTWYSLNGGWLEDYAGYHVGTALLLEAMQSAAAAGARRYSLLEGEEPYKMRMATGGHQLASWDIHLNATS